MNEKQLKAIKQLQLAFKECKKQKLLFQGMDDDLFCFDEIDYSDALKESSEIRIHECRWQALNILQDKNKIFKIKDYGSYLDSGGW